MSIGVEGAIGFGDSGVGLGELTVSENGFNAGLDGILKVAGLGEGGIVLIKWQFMEKVNSLT